MNERTPIAPVSALKRGASIPQPPPRRSRVTEPPVDNSSSEGRSSAAGKPPPRKAARTTRQTGASASAHRDQAKPISLSVPADLLTEFRRFAKRTEISYADLLMDAVAAHRDDLAELVTAAQSSLASDGLFVRETSASTGALSTLSLRMLAVNVAALDELAERCGAESRSQMCVAALTSYLAIDSDRR